MMKCNGRAYWFIFFTFGLRFMSVVTLFPNGVVDLSPWFFEVVPAESFLRSYSLFMPDNGYLLVRFASADEAFKCPEQFGYYPDLRDCSKYYVCVFGDSLHEKCTGGLFFSVELQTCDWPRNVECANGEKPGEAPAIDFDVDDEVFSSSRRTSATAAAGVPRPPNPEPVSNYQPPPEEGSGPRDYSRNRPRQVEESAATLPPQPGPTTGAPPEDPLYLSDQRSKVSDSLGNYDPQQPDFDEAAPPLIDSEGGIHVADGGHGLDAFGGLAHLPGLGDYSVIAKPIYNENSGAQQSDDSDYKRRSNSGSTRNHASISTKPRSLESFQSNNGKSNDPDFVIDFANGNKNHHWNHRTEPKNTATPPPTIFDDNAGHRDYGGFDVITPLKTIQADHEPEMKQDHSGVDLRNIRKTSVIPNESEQSKSAQENRNDKDPARQSNSRGNKAFYDSDGPNNQDSSLSSKKVPDKSSLDEVSDFSRLQRNYNTEAKLESDFRSEDRSNPESEEPEYRNREETLRVFLDGDARYSSLQNNRNGNQRQGSSFETLRSTPNRNRNTDSPDNSQRIVKSENDATYRRQGDHRGSSKDDPIPSSENEDFGVYTGSQRQNRKLDIDIVPANQNIEASKGIIPAESIQPAVRQPNRISPENTKDNRKEEKDFSGPDQPFREEYDEMPRGYEDYDSSKPQYTDTYYTDLDEPDTTTRIPVIRTRPTRPRRPITTTTTTTTTTTPAPIRVRTRKPVSAIVPPTKTPSVATTPVTFPRRPASVHPTPAPYSVASKCDPRVCRLPDCRCGGTTVPGGLSPEEVPQIVVLTFDDAVNDLNDDLYDELFNSGRTNPNGCPILGTFYVSHEWTDYGQVQTLYSKGHEIASHSITHSYGEKFSKTQWQREISGQREILHLYGGVRMEDIRGMRAPFLQIGGNKMFEMLYDANFTYDSSMPVYENNPPFWPYTLDYGLNHECMIFPCPSKSYPGLWEVGMVMWVDLGGGRCSMGDACSNPPDEEAVTKMLMKNFNRHYKSNKAPFGLFYHSAWFNTQHHRRGFMKFLDEILKKEDVYFVTNWQLIQWMRNPTPLSQIKDFEPFNCRKLDRPPPCPNPTVCNVWYQGGVRYMKTCQPCPIKYPWIGNTGYDSKGRG